MHKGISSLVASGLGSSLPKKRRERKGKDQIIGRNFICGCGKSYLSYAALYTHTKTKHAGVFPAGTSTLKKSRLKKNELNSSSVNQNFDLHKAQEFNQSLVAFLEKVPGAPRSSDEDSFNPVEDFPTEIFCPESDFRVLLSTLAKMHKGLVGAYGEEYLKQFEWILFEISLCKGLTCYEIFALFLLHVYRFVSKEFFAELVFLIVSFACMLNLKGWAKCKELVSTFHPKKNKNYCLHQGAEIVPDMSNEFILKFFPKAMETSQVLQDPSMLSFFGNDSIKILRAILVIKQMSNWLSIFSFSQARIEILKH